MKAAPVKRTYSKLPVWIVEDHHEVVPHIYRAIASRHLPLSGVKMVHLDSHPDLLISVNMSAKTVFDKEALFSELSIENWIMPMVFAGHVSHVAWLHPYWAQQIKEGEHYMCVGKDKSTGTIRVTSTDDYFLSDALYVPTDQLEDSKPLHLRVVNVDPVGTSHSSHTSQKEDHTAVKKPKINANNEADTQPSTCTLQPPDGSSTSGNSHSPDTQTQPAEGSAAHVVSGLLGLIEQNDAYILDIDLDFFSCKNPFKDLYTQEEYSILQELYSFKRPKEDVDEGELSDCVERRTRQLEDLEAAFADLLEDDSQNTIDRWSANPGMKSLAKLVRSLKERTEVPDYEMVHQAGLTCDYSELPHHISSEDEIQRLLQAVQLVVKTLPKPTIVTISRSSLDEYCPAEQVDSIQSSMLEILETLFGSLDVHKDYESSTEESTSKSS
uniref:Chromosome 5 open reading frame 22 n=1 Tax=Astyanax mexicanus TaxID=7994 RepID=W5L3H4_ASTMX